MKVTQEQRDYVASKVKTERPAVLRKELEGQGLTKTQANCCVRNQRKKAGVYGKKIGVNND
jgi:hypothetical protein